MGTKIQCPKSDITQLTFQLPDEAFGFKSKTLSTHTSVSRQTVLRFGVEVFYWSELKISISPDTSET